MSPFHSPTLTHSGNLTWPRWFVARFVVFLSMVQSILAIVAFEAQAGSPAIVTTPRDSINTYLEYVETYPHLVAKKGDWHAGEIEIITDAKRMRLIQNMFEARYQKRFDANFAHSASRVGVIAQDPFILVVREAVIFPSGKEGLYDRAISRSTLDGGVAGAYCVPIDAHGKVLLSREFRHQERSWRLGLFGGFREVGESAADAARREVVEEAGTSLGPLTLLGEVDGGNEHVPLFVGSVTGERRAPTPDEGEALGSIVAFDVADIRNIVAAGIYRDSTGRVHTLHGALASAVLMLEAWQRRTEAKASPAGTSH